MTFLLHFIFIAAFLLIYIIAIIILKPFRMHRKRPVSTIFIKASYLVYLACFPPDGLPDSFLPPGS